MWRRAPVAAVLFVLFLAAFLAGRLPLLPHRSFDPDELEHAHAAWSVFNGMLPYKDFFEHHTPWYYYGLAPFFRWFAVQRSLDDALGFLLLGRGLSWVLALASILIVIWIGRLWTPTPPTDDRPLGLVTALLLVSQPIFLQKTIEMRPDVPALVLFLAAVGFLLRGIRHDAAVPARRPGVSFLVGGLALGAAVMCTQKMLFVLPGALAGLGLWWLLAGSDDTTGPNGRRRSRLLCIFLFALGMCLPGVLTWAAFAGQGAGQEFITNNFLLNARWKHFATKQLLRVIVTSWPVLLLALLGASVFLARVLRQRRPARQPPHRREGHLSPREAQGLLLLSVMVGLFLGVLVMPVPHRQYYLMPLPIVCLFAAEGLFALVDRVRERTRPWLLAGTLSLLAILPVVALVQSFRDRNDQQLGRLRYVFDHTAPTDPVMDGWTGLGVFRPHAFRYFFLHEEAIAMLPAAAWKAYLDDLESGRVRPRLIALDKNLQTLGPRFLRFVRERYTTSDGFFYLANGISR